MTAAGNADDLCTASGLREDAPTRQQSAGIAAEIAHADRSGKPIRFIDPVTLDVSGRSSSSPSVTRKSPKRCVPGMTGAGNSDEKNSLRDMVIGPLHHFVGVTEMVGELSGATG